AAITGVVKDNAGNPVPSVLVKLMKDVSSPYAVSYAITGVDGSYSITGVQGVGYSLSYEFPTEGYTAGSANPGAVFTAAAAQAEDDFVLNRKENTITNCNVTPEAATNWLVDPLLVQKATTLNSDADLQQVYIYNAARLNHPEVTFTVTNG